MLAGQYQDLSILRLPQRGIHQYQSQLIIIPQTDQLQPEYKRVTLSRHKLYRTPVVPRTRKNYEAMNEKRRSRHTKHLY